MSSKNLRLGIIGSSGGSALMAADGCLRAAGLGINWVVVTDRDCPLGRWAEKAGYSFQQMNYFDADEFSVRAHAALVSAGCGDVLLFFTRRVATPLIDRLRVWNIHPSLLPAFRGMGAVEKTREGGARLFGATLHRVDAGLDTGPIVAQVASAFPEAGGLESAHRLSYFQKVWLTLVWFERVTQAKIVDPLTLPFGPGGALASPGLADGKLKACFDEWVKREERMSEGRS